MSIREELEREPGVHTLFEDEDGNLVIQCDDTAHCRNIEVAVHSSRDCPTGMLRDKGGNAAPVKVEFQTRPMAIPPEYDVLSSEQTSHRQCHNVPKGGCQIAPKGAGWVGTLGGACSFVADGKRRYGAITNWHVANGGRFGINAWMAQPHANGPEFGFQASWEDIELNQQASNVMDVSLIDCEVGDHHLISPEMIGLGKLARTWNESPQRGQTVMKTGRTTGVQKGGKITATGVTTFVNYGNGVARFVNQLQIKQDGREFSAGGDSGSLIVDTNMQPIALLFAGSPGVTIASPLAPIVEKFHISFDLGQ